jgi:hypothetical protein
LVLSVSVALVLLFGGGVGAFSCWWCQLLVVSVVGGVSCPWPWFCRLVVSLVVSVVGAVGFWWPWLLQSFC